MRVTEVKHPLIIHKMSLLRDKSNSSATFRRLIEEISLFLAYEMTLHLPLEEAEIETPMQTMKGRKLSGLKPVLLPIMRAGLGMVEGVLKIMPSAKVGHIGIFRNEETLEPNLYYFKIPQKSESRHYFVLDPMLATAGSASFAIQSLKEKNVKQITMVCLLCAPEGIERLNKDHPDVPIITASIDEKLNDQGYILPGLGDAGDRIFGTK